MSNKVKKVVGVEPVAHQILVEFLNPEDLYETKLDIKGIAIKEAPQAYVLKIGPGVDKSVYNINVGDRVVVVGNCTYIPEIQSDRKIGVLEPHCVKAVLKEDK